jgi:hypothetical protein
MVFFSDSIEKAFRKHSAAAEKSPSKSVKGAVLIACGILLNFLQRSPGIHSKAQTHGDTGDD